MGALAQRGSADEIPQLCFCHFSGIVDFWLFLRYSVSVWGNGNYVDYHQESTIIPGQQGSEGCGRRGGRGKIGREKDTSERGDREGFWY
jgi:hypothetical protein